MTIGYVGLGNMGGALAASLAPHENLMVYDLNVATIDAQVERGAKAVRDAFRKAGF